MEQPIDSTATATPRRRTRVVVFVCIASAALGGFFGGCASIPYTIGFIESPSHRPLVSLISTWCMVGGLAAGLVVGVFWCRAMLKARTATMLNGVIGGIAAGVACTLVIHVPVNILLRRFDGFAVSLGLAIGIFVGALLGAIGIALASCAPATDLTLPSYDSGVDRADSRPPARGDA